MARQRLDTVLAERGLAPSRSAAATAVRAGEVRVGVDGPVATKPSQLVEGDAEIVLASRPRYVSRGGTKLANALDALGVEVAGLSCLDVGASTGGFTDCLLQRGARRVVALDVGRGQLDWNLRNDERVHVLEARNARGLDPRILPWRPEMVTVDVSFISLAKVLPALAAATDLDAELLALVKPQFELSREHVGKGGVVRDAADRRAAVADASRAAREAGFGLLDATPSGLAGPKGNRESFIHGRRGARSALDDEEIARRAEP